MIATKPHTSSMLGFKYLKPIKETIPKKPTSFSPAFLKRDRLLNCALGLIYGVAAAVSIGLSFAEPKPVATTTVSEAIAEHDLWETLGSPKFMAWQQRYQVERTAALLAEAEEDRAIAKDYKVLASQELAASLLPHAPGEDVVSTTAVLVRCFDEGDFGWAAALKQIDAASPYEKYGTVGHLAACYPGEKDAGSAIGKAGRFQPTVRD